MISRYLFSLLLFSFSVSAQSNFEKKLIVSCKEAVKLFEASTTPERREFKLSLNQSFSTSNTEALQIGYCKGVIDAVMQMEAYCRYDHWYPIAARLVKEQARGQNMIEFIHSAC